MKNVSSERMVESNWGKFPYHLTMDENGTVVTVEMNGAYTVDEMQILEKALIGFIKSDAPEPQKYIARLWYDKLSSVLDDLWRVVAVSE